MKLMYEKTQRPEEKRHGPWLDRVVTQANAAFAELERAAEGAKPWLSGERFNAADVAVACAWRFAQYYDADEVVAAKYPALVAYSRRAEMLPEFVSTPVD